MKKTTQICIDSDNEDEVTALQHNRQLSIEINMFLRNRRGAVKADHNTKTILESNNILVFQEKEDIEAYIKEIKHKTPLERKMIRSALERALVKHGSVKYNAKEGKIIKEEL
jgi:hypothetical protein